MENVKTDTFAKGGVVRSKLSPHGVILFHQEPNQNFARNISHVFGVQKGIFLANSDLSYKVHEDVVLGAEAEMEMAREQEVRNGAAQALFLPDSGQGTERGQHCGKGGRGSRSRNRWKDDSGDQQQQQ